MISRILTESQATAERAASSPSVAGVMKENPVSGQGSPTERASVLPNLVDIQTVARCFGISIRQVRRLVADGEIPFVRVGHLIRFDSEEPPLGSTGDGRVMAAPKRPLAAVKGGRRSAQRTLDGCVATTHRVPRWQRSAGHGRPDRHGSACEPRHSSEEE